MPTSDGSQRDSFEPVDPDEPVAPETQGTRPPSEAPDLESRDREPTTTPEMDAVRRHTSLGRTKAAATWTGLVIGVLVLILLLVFILQNLDSVNLKLFLWEISVPLGVGLLLAAIAGALIMALAGGVRIIQIRRLAKRAANPR